MTLHPSYLNFLVYEEKLHFFLSVYDDWNAACNQDEENWQPYTGTPSSEQVQDWAHSVHYQNGGTFCLGV